MTQIVDSTRQLVVELLVRDLATARRFYEAFGFTCVRQTEGFAVLTWEESQLFLDERPGLTDPPTDPSMNIRVMVQDTDSFWRVARELGARVVSPIADRFYGLRDFTIADPDGYGVRFAHEIKCCNPPDEP